MTSVSKLVLHPVLRFLVVAEVIIPQGYGQFANFRINYINNLRYMHLPINPSQFRWFLVISIVYFSVKIQLGM